MKSKLSYKIKYSIIGAILVPCFGRIALSGTDHADQYFRYIVPLFVGSIAGFLIGKMKDRWVSRTEELELEIANRKLIEKKVTEQKESLAVTLRSIGDGVITTNLVGNIVLVNKVTEQLTGWSQEEAVGKPIQDIFKIFNENTGDPCENPVEKVLSTGKIIGLANHTALIARDGTRYSIADSGAPIFDNENQIIGTVLVFRDVTEKNKTSEELLKIKKLESIGVLAGGIAHDFNNILTAILGNINLAREHIESDNQAYLLLEEAEKASIRARDLTLQLLTFSEGGSPVKKTASITKVITDSTNFILHGTPILSRFNIPEDIWLVDVDAGQISQVIQNIVMNARYAIHGNGEIIVACSNITDIKDEPVVLPEGDYVRIIIQDNGVGIKKEDLDKIFDPYFTTNHMGRGLGLAITNSIVKKHNGSISVESTIGEGTTIIIYLPASKNVDLESVPEEVTVETLHNAKILIMDDDEMIQDISKQMLENLGHEVFVTGEGKEAIEVYNEYLQTENPIDIVIMDLTIPGGMGGKNAVQEILKINPEAKVIVASGYSNDPVMTNYQEYGFVAAITKPFRLTELEQVINDTL